MCYCWYNAKNGLSKGTPSELCCYTQVLYSVKCEEQEKTFGAVETPTHPQNSQLCTGISLSFIIAWLTMKTEIRIHYEVKNVPLVPLRTKFQLVLSTTSHFKLKAFMRQVHQCHRYRIYVSLVPNFNPFHHYAQGFWVTDHLETSTKLCQKGRRYSIYILLVPTRPKISIIHHLNQCQIVHSYTVVSQSMDN